MRIHRTTPTRAFSVFSNTLLRDRSLSWCAVGVLTYLLSLPDGARATIRTLSEQRKEGRSRIASALRELEDSRYLRRVVRQDPETRQFSTVYEVFDTPYEDEPPTGEPEKVQNRDSGESDGEPSGPSPSGENTGGKEPPSPPPVAPLVEEWWEAGASSAQVRAALASGLPARVYSAGAIVENRLQRKRPSAPTAGPVRTVEVELRKPGAAVFREAAQRGGALARALLRGGPAPA
ncbi:hypothetical protein [Streptomyces sp. T028]|uniref:hypothetical protein n=1 Tax=Streptomyces sp. T028 TaxID=3394379 RepID=UPI003A8BC553